MTIAFNIIEALQSGDELVFKQVYETYHEKVYAKILSKTRSGYLAEEVVQLTFIKLWQYREHLTTDFALSTQIFRIAATTLVDVLRKKYASEKKLNGKRSLSEPAFEHQRNVVDEKWFAFSINRILHLMPHIRRKAFEMSRFGGFSHREIASSLSISEKAVENHIYKATRQLKKLISIEYITFLVFFVFTH